jgi:acyl-CoA synthetase (NDP forming)
MKPARQNLQRLLAPRSLAFVGGRGMALAARRCQQQFDGPVWLVNPQHDSLEGLTCYPSVEALPAAPDGVFLGVNRQLSLDFLPRLRALGAGGVVCYASGFAEAGAEGPSAQEQLVAAAGSMALLGPNCFGLVDGLHGAALWPVAHGAPRVQQGAAVLTQSGNFAYNLSMCAQEFPMAYLVSMGNQAQLGVAQLLDALLDDDRITAIGLHLEGLKDLPAFSRAAYRALELGVPIVALKVGVSEQGAALALGHTSALSGNDAVYAALFERLGILRVADANAFVETLRAATVGRRPQSAELLALTCSGGDAGFVADHADAAGLQLPALPEAVRDSLRQVLPSYAQLTNPLDFTTAVWGDERALEQILDTVLGLGQQEARLLVIDFPTEASGERGPCELLLKLFAHQAGQSHGPALVAPVFQGLLPAAMRHALQQAGIPAFHSLQSGLLAWGQLVRYQTRRALLLRRGEAAMPLLEVPAEEIVRMQLDEWAARQLLQAHGLPFAAAQRCRAEEAPARALQMGFPLALKVLSADVPHKTEVGGVALQLNDAVAVAHALTSMRESLARYAPHVVLEQVLLEPMAAPAVAELLVGVRRELGMGLVLVLGLGGVTAELLKDTRCLLLPTNAQAIRAALQGLQLAPLLQGYRSRPGADLDAAVQAIEAVAQFAGAQVLQLIELEINPLLLHSCGCTAVDALMCVDERSGL